MTYAETLELVRGLSALEMDALGYVCIGQMESPVPGERARLHRLVSLGLLVETTRDLPGDPSGPPIARLPVRVPAWDPASLIVSMAWAERCAELEKGEGP